MPGPRRISPFQRRAFLDSSGFLAVASPTDAHHRDALAVWERMNVQRWHLTTTNFVVAETHALFITRLGHRHALNFLTRIRGSTVAIERVTSEDELRAEQIIFAYRDKVFSYTDAASFAVMERLGITHAFTYDKNFAQYGCVQLTPDLL